MCSLPSSTRSISDFEASWEDGDFRSTSQRFDIKELIQKANSVDLLLIFKYYRLPIDAINKKVVCPFRQHKNGKEKTGSFFYYPETNSFNCYGCGIGGKVCNFISAMEDISKTEAMFKALKLFENDISDEYIYDIDITNNLSIMIDFSNFIRNNRFKHTDQTYSDFIENNMVM